MLFNLIGNVSKYILEGGEIEVIVKMIGIDIIV